MTLGSVSQWEQNILEAATGIDQLVAQGGAAGVQYTDGAPAPAHPTGTQIMFNNGGIETAVSNLNGLPVNASNPSVGTDGSTAPTSSTQIGGQTAGGNLVALFVDASGRLYVNVNSLPSITGTVTANIDATNSTHLANIDTATASGATAANQATGNTSLSNINTVSGATTDAAVVGDNNGTISAKLRGLTKILNAIWDSTNNLFHSNIKQIGGQALALGQTTKANSLPVTLPSDQILFDSSNQLVSEDFIRYLAMQGKCFRVTTGLIATNAANAYVCMQLIANNLSKRILIYNIVCSMASGASSGDVRLYANNANTADSNLTGTAPTAVNQQPASATTATVTLKVSPASTTQTSGFVGTLAEEQTIPGNATIQLLSLGSAVYFAANDVGSAELAMKISTSGNSGAITFEWAEF